MTKPFLKWVGGKTQIIDEVLVQFPQTFVNYYEPFLGGGSVLFALLSHIKSGKIRITGKIYASDLNPNLINVYKVIQSRHTELCTELRTLIDACPRFTPKSFEDVRNEYTRLQSMFSRIRNHIDSNASYPTKEADELSVSPEAYYYSIRTAYNQLSDRQSVRAAAMFIYLNKTCFRGVYRDGPNGFNVPYGHYDNPIVFDETHIQEVSSLIRNVVFACVPFQDALDRTATGDFIYLDPPYAPEDDKSFVGYTTDGFGLDSHLLLFRTAADLSTKHVKFLMSNADVKLVRDAFPSQTYQTKTIVCRRAIHSKKPDTKTNEVLITNTATYPAS